MLSLIALTSLLTAVSATPHPLAERASTATLSIDPTQQFQEVDGFGCSEAFTRAEDVLGGKGLSPTNQTYVLDLLFDVTKGAGFTILRNGIGSSNSSGYGRMNSIQPFNPGGPSKTNYTWDGYASGQFPLAQQAVKRGLPYVYADAWSAPPYMKTNGDDANGGHLCGVMGENCADGNWTQAYANYLIQNLKYYAQGGVTITHLGLFNEPSYSPNYASINTNGTQAAQIIKILGQTLEAENMNVQITCCDDFGWDLQEKLIPGLQIVGADGKSGQDYIGVMTGHGYESPPTYPLSTPRKVWQTEWASLDGAYTPHTFFANGAAPEGMTWANNIQVAFANANVSAFLYWIGAENSTTNSALINLINDEVVPSKRFWTYAQFSKFVRPGARRIKATSGTSGINVTAFRNSNGLVSIQVLNNLTTTTTVSASFGSKGYAIPYVTNNDYDLEQLAAITTASDGSFTGSVPARSLVSFVQSTTS